MKKKNFIFQSLLIVTLFVTSGCDDYKKPAGLNGTVTDGITGQPISKAEITLSGETVATSTTGDNGTYAFTDLNEGNHRILVTKQGYKSNNIDVTVSYGKIERGDIALQPNSNSSQIEISNDNPNFGTDKTEITLFITSKLAVNTSFTASTTNGWIKQINPQSGTLEPNNPKAFTITIDRNHASFTTGINTGAITFTSTNAVKIPPITVTAIK
jgi:hypothetical protein